MSSKLAQILAIGDSTQGSEGEYFVESLKIKLGLMYKTSEKGYKLIVRWRN